MKNLLCASAMLLAISFTSGCASSNHAEKAPAQPLNSVCLISGESLDADSPTVDYMGGKVAFCCPKCIGKWEKMDDNAKKAAFEKAKK